MSVPPNSPFVSEEPPQPGFTCGICYEWHDNLPMSYSVRAPMAVAVIPEHQLDRRVIFTLDQCIIDGRDFYLRGRIPVPIIGMEQPFIWGVWARISKEDFTRANDMWKVPGRENEPPFRGWLDSAIPFYGDTLNLALRVWTQVVGRRPSFELLDSTHPVAREQQDGVSMQRVRDIAAEFVHSATNVRSSFEP
jgi:hypothetical protein